MGRQKSAEGILSLSTGLKARTCITGKEPGISTESADADRQAEMSVTGPEGSRRNRRDYVDGVSRPTARTDNSCPQTVQMMEAVVERENMIAALFRVESNKGSAGVDEMTVESLRSYLSEHWSHIKEQLLADRYIPSPVRRADIPKPNGKGMRQLGIPTVIDRLIQQALHQVMQPVFDGDFSESSYGFRPVPCVIRASLGS